MSDVTRRRFLALTGTTAAAVWLTDIEAFRAAGMHAVTADGFAVLTPADAADIEAATAQIIPTDETPGAREARVIYFIDKGLETFAKGQRDLYRTGAKELRARAAKKQRGARTFAELSPPLQIEILTALDKEKHPFFQELRGATIAGMLAQPDYGGNYEKTGWKWIGFDDRFVWFAPFGGTTAMPDHVHPALDPLPQSTVEYRPDDEVDFVIVGSGAAGGVVAKELSTAGFRVVVLEQGPWRTEKDFVHDEIKIFNQNWLTNSEPHTFRKTEKDTAKAGASIMYGRGVGGTSVHFSANFWRFRELDFHEASVRGPIAGTGLADWPISYQDLEPYYTKVDWEIGVAGLPGPFDPPRSRPYPMPPHPPKSTGVLLERGAAKLGWTAFPAPVAIASTALPGRAACIQCGLCLGFGCEVRAKSSSLVSVIPVAVATGRCEFRTGAYVRKIETNAQGRVTGVRYFGAGKQEFFQRAKAVVVCANGAETPRLLLNSKSNLFPHGLANSSGVVGKYLMFNGGGISLGVFDHEVNGFKGLVASRIVWDLYDVGPSLGLVGGGGFDYRFDMPPIQYALGGLPPKSPTWGRDYKKLVANNYTRTVQCYGHTSSLPVASNNISLDPHVKDSWGMPSIRMTYQDHPQDLKLYQHFADRGEELLKASGAVQTWQTPVESQTFSVHLLGTCRMGNDPKTSVVDKFNRAHDVKNLFIVDGSSLVSCGRGQPTMTIQALAFRAGEHIAEFAKRGEI